LVVAVGVSVCSTITPGVYGVELKFDIEKLGATCVYPCPNILAVVCRDIPKLGAKPSMVVQL
jgi:hypothetical protein